MAVMSTHRWDRRRALAPVDPLALDELAGGVLVLPDVTAEDDDGLAWCRSAPCVVVGVVPAGRRPPRSPDVVLGDDRPEVLDDLLAAIGAAPRASKVLVDVLRAMPDLDVPSGLTLESLAYSTLLAGPEFADWLRGRPEPRARDHHGPPVRTERRGSRLEVTLARPENRNAFSAPMRDALFEVLTAAEVDADLDEVVLRAEGPDFSSGGHLGEFGTAADPLTAHEIRLRRSVGAVLDRLAARVTVRVHGACVGAGVELPAFADRVVAAADTTFRLPEVGMGLIPGAGGTVSLTRRLGRQETARLALLGCTLGAAEARELGLVDEVA